MRECIRSTLHMEQQFILSSLIQRSISGLLKLANLDSLKPLRKLLLMRTIA